MYTKNDDTRAITNIFLFIREYKTTRKVSECVCVYCITQNKWLRHDSKTNKKCSSVRFCVCIRKSWKKKIAIEKYLNNSKMLCIHNCIFFSCIFYWIHRDIYGKCMRWCINAIQCTYIYATTWLFNYNILVVMWYVCVYFIFYGKFY